MVCGHCAVALGASGVPHLETDFGVSFVYFYYFRNEFDPDCCFYGSVNIIVAESMKDGGFSTRTVSSYYDFE